MVQIVQRLLPKHIYRSFFFLLCIDPNPRPLDTLSQMPVPPGEEVFCERVVNREGTGVDTQNKRGAG
jgi:hypothetical protein